MAPLGLGARKMVLQRLRSPFLVSALMATSIKGLPPKAFRSVRSTCSGWHEAEALCGRSWFIRRRLHLLSKDAGVAHLSLCCRNGGSLQTALMVRLWVPRLGHSSTLSSRAYNLPCGTVEVTLDNSHLTSVLWLLQPAQFFVRKRSSEKLEVLVTMSVLEAKSCGAETPPRRPLRPESALLSAAPRLPP